MQGGRGRGVECELERGVGDVEVGGWDVAAPEGGETFGCVDAVEGGEGGGVELCWLGRCGGCGGRR